MNIIKKNKMIFQSLTLNLKWLKLALTKMELLVLSLKIYIKHQISIIFLRKRVVYFSGPILGVMEAITSTKEIIRSQNNA